MDDVLVVVVIERVIVVDHVTGVSGDIIGGDIKQTFFMSAKRLILPVSRKYLSAKLPEIAMTNFRFQAAFEIVGNDNTHFQTGFVNANNVNDPGLALTAGNVLGHAQWELMYTNYRVLAMKLTLLIKPHVHMMRKYQSNLPAGAISWTTPAISDDFDQSHDDLMVVVIPSTSVTPESNIATIMNHKHARVFSVPSLSVGRLTRATFSLSLKDFYRASYLNADGSTANWQTKYNTLELFATASTSMDWPVRLHIYVIRRDQHDTTAKPLGISGTLLLDYYTEMQNPIIQNVS